MLSPEQAEQVHDLRMAFNRAMARYDDLISAADQMKGLLDDAGWLDITLPKFTSVLQRVFTHWLTTMLDERSAEARGVAAKAHIGVDSLDGLESLYNTDDDILCEVRTGRMSRLEYVHTFFKHYDFEGLYRKIDELARKLEGSAIRNAADTIGRELNLVRVRSWSQPAGIVRQKKHAVVESSIYYSYGSYDYSNFEKFHALADALDLMRADAGGSDLAQGVRALASALKATKWNEPLPSRTVTGEDTAMPATVFSEKVKFKLSHQDADTLLAFVKLHTDLPLWDGTETQGVAA